MDGTCKIWTSRGGQIGMGIEMGVFFLSSEQTLTSSCATKQGMIIIERKFW